jgi:hypothetical protein
MNRAAPEEIRGGVSTSQTRTGVLGFVRPVVVLLICGGFQPHTVAAYSGTAVGPFLIRFPGKCRAFSGVTVTL